MKLATATVGDVLVYIKKKERKAKKSTRDRSKIASRHLKANAFRRGIRWIANWLERWTRRADKSRE